MLEVTLAMPDAPARLPAALSASIASSTVCGLSAEVAWHSSMLMSEITLPSSGMLSTIGTLAGVVVFNARGSGPAIEHPASTNSDRHTVGDKKPDFTIYP